MTSKKCIAIDIDGTLFYTSSKKFNNSIKLQTNHYAIIRPHVDVLFEYLKENQEYFDVIIYSAATNDYINDLLKLINTNNIIKNIYDRKYCDLIQINNKPTYIKNAKKLNYDLSNLYLIDDNVYHFDQYDILGYNCKSFNDKLNDDLEIFKIIDFLETLKLI